MRHHFSPLRYPGGKAKLTKYFKEIISINSIGKCQYVEPYAGGASLGLNLLVSGLVEHIHINDIDLALFSFWKAVLSSPDEICSKIEKTPVTINEWYNQKSIYKNLNLGNFLDLGFATFFLNRTNRSGILNGGIIGGKNQQGNWKIDARYNKNDLINRIQRIASYKKQISIYNMDALKFITRHPRNLPANSLFYLDPPYYHKGQGLYKNYYKFADHQNIACLLQANFNFPWVVSYDNEAVIEELYSSRKKIVYTLNYSAQKTRKGQEIIIFSDKMSIPTISPISISRTKKSEIDPSQSEQKDFT